jgi:hypothetical protein
MATVITQYPLPTPDLFDHDDHLSPIMSDKKATSNHSTFFKGEFSFVNKDAKNIESKDHNAAVSWHVMNRYERWKKQEQAKKLRASANIPTGTASGSSHSSVADVRQSSRSRSRGSPSTPSVQAATPSTNYGYDPWTDRPMQPDVVKASTFSTAMPDPGLLMSAVSSPSNQSSPMDDAFSILNAESNIDFSTPLTGTEVATISTDPMTTKLSTFAYEYLVPHLWPMEPGNVQGSYEIARCWDEVAAMSHDTCYANAYSALLATLMADFTHDDCLAYQAQVFQGKAMAELKQRVSTGNAGDLLSLKAILKLFCSETIVDNTSVARLHLKMLRNLVCANGGVILLDSWFREDLLSCDCYFALKYGTRPVLPAAEWTPGPLSQPWKARLVSAGVFGDHAAGVDSSVEHPILKSIFMDLREVFKTQEYALSHEVQADDQLLRWRQLRKFDCISRLADHYTNLTIYAHLFDFPRTQAMTTIATALLTNLILGCPEPVRFGNRLMEELRCRIVDSECELKESDGKRLRLWALYIGSLAERIHPQGLPNEKWFSLRLKESTAELGLQSWEDMKKLLRQLLFSVRLHDEVEGGRAHRTHDFRKGLYSISGVSWRLPIQPQLRLTSTTSFGG